MFNNKSVYIARDISYDKDHFHRSLNFVKLCGSREIRLTIACQRPEAYRVTVALV